MLISSPFCIGSLKFQNRLIQGPLAGVSAAPFRRLFYQFLPPAYAVSEMLSAQEVLTRHDANSRYLYRAPEEKYLCYQLAGRDSMMMADAAFKLQEMGADLIDINCGCPKIKIRKKGAGSALMDDPERLLKIVSDVRQKISIPLTVKLRIYGSPKDITLAKMLEEAGVDALIIHGRRWTDDYDTPCNFEQMRLIKQQVNLPVIGNGDVTDVSMLNHAMCESSADAYMISRAGCGRPWLYQELLTQVPVQVNVALSLAYFIEHIQHLSELESEYQAVIQSRKFVRYYFRHVLSSTQLEHFYKLTTFEDVKQYLIEETSCLD